MLPILLHITFRSTFARLYHICSAQLILRCCLRLLRAPSDKASAAEFASSSLNAAVVFRDSVAAALEHSPLFDCIIACEDSFRDALKDRSLFFRLSGTTVLCLSDKLFFKIDLSQKGSYRSEARASALLSSLMAKCGFRRGTLGCSYIRDAVLMCLFLDVSPAYILCFE